MTRMTLDDWEGKSQPQLPAKAPRRHRKAESDEAADAAVGFVNKLSAAKNALARAEDIPEITTLRDHAEALRAAAKALHISTEGINAWTRFVIDAERKAWARIEAMRETGELRSKGGDPKTVAKANALDLSDVIDRNPRQRASEWSQLARLSDAQIDEAERLANEEERLLTRLELFKLAKAGMPTAARSKEPPPRSDEDLELIEKAREHAAEGYSGDDIQIDDDAKITRSDRGWWIAAWVWVEDELAKSDL